MKETEEMSSTSLLSLEPNPPLWPTNVKIIEPGDPNAQATIDSIYQENGGHNPSCHGQWSKSRYAILFKPGDHTNLNVNVGYYTSILGLGLTPQDTHIGTVTSENGDYNYKHGALDNFWRSAENFYIKPTKLWNKKKSMLWAVSQGTSLRRVYIEGDLCLSESTGSKAGYASGGFMSDCTVTGSIYSGSQQQWFARNTQMQSWPNSLWNMCFLGCIGAPSSYVNNIAVTNVDDLYKTAGLITNQEATPIIAEKPYIAFQNGRYYLVRPKLEKEKKGASADYGAGNLIDFENIYVATEQDSAAVINEKIAQGTHIVLCPGQYHLTESIQIQSPNVCLLGIGYPTLISSNGNACITVGNVEGVQIAGILLQAGPKPTAALLDWGNIGYVGDPDNPGFLYDCFARVGGDNDPAVQQMQTEIMVRINSENIVGDNFWLWRADHDIKGTVTNRMNPCSTALQVLGDHITIYGLAAEHTLKNIIEWKGNGGKVYFYQSELPYDVTNADYGSLGYVSYKVDDSVTDHQAWGVGVYSSFIDPSNIVSSGIQTPSTQTTIHFTNCLTVCLNKSGQITHVINDAGHSVQKDNLLSTVSNFP